MEEFEKHIKRMKSLRDLYEAGTGQHNILSMLIKECDEALRQSSVVGRSEQLVCGCGNKLTDKELYFGQCLQCDKNIEEQQTNCLQRFAALFSAGLIALNNI